MWDKCLAGGKKILRVCKWLKKRSRTVGASGVRLLAVARVHRFGRLGGTGSIAGLGLGWEAIRQEHLTSSRRGVFRQALARKDAAEQPGKARRYAGLFRVPGASGHLWRFNGMGNPTRTTCVHCGANLGPWRGYRGWWTCPATEQHPGWICFCAIWCMCVCCACCL